MKRSTFSRRLTTALVTAGLALAACSSAGHQDAGPFAVWDPYPQFDGNSAWAEVIDECGAAAGVEVERQAYDTSDLTNKVLLAAQQGTAPNVLVVDNPVVSTLAEGGVLKANQDTGLDASQASPNLVAAGESGGKTYGVPIGANTLALYYNKAVLAQAGVDPASLTDWASLDAALAAVTGVGKKGITFSAIGTEEGSFQFLPWFWGAGARLTDLSSAQAVAAVELWKSWLDKGYAPNSVVGNTQTTGWQEFATGEYAFAENGTWQLGNAAELGFEYGVIPIPSRDGGVAPAPTGGEFVTVPVQGQADREATAARIAACLTGADTVLATDTALTYVSAIPAVRERQVAAKPELAVWVDAVQAAKGRTGDGLGTRYPRISQPLWTAVQAVLTGSKPAADALEAAQSAAASAR
ncbi:carbohydrate ABC transporter substrate-binding protein (CUT1 family) [Saccharothrix saharensis]|uniref:Carbohydrate ABC transporter substrate-binding protein (CUT1 family) n=1 Tax=Saccharothrix saharensis TaxID=571190 RepID=A0A543J6R4_9PSEU|nr:extracellular solute-binding protein [Saccharothrix saharensis]TQM78529.1 carbohydrate ABC transporter substrate-binding protein (CUT1 family) [Saccharothrix saharensis]